MKGGVNVDKHELQLYIDRLQSAFHTIMRKIRAELSEHMESGLTGAQYFILRLLATKEEWTVTELADAMGVKPSAITAMVDRMVKCEFVLRGRDEADRRLVIVRLSDRGREVFNQCEPKRREIIERYLNGLEPAELEFLVKIYEKLAGQVQ